MNEKNNRGGNRGNKSADANKPADNPTPPTEQTATTPTPPPAADNPPAGFAWSTDESGNRVAVPAPTPPTPPPAAAGPVNPVAALLAKRAAEKEAAAVEKKKGKTLADMLAGVGAGAGRKEYPVKLATGRVLSAAGLCRWFGYMGLSRRDAVACLAGLAKENPKLLELSENTVSTQYSHGKKGTGGEVPNLSEAEAGEVLNAGGLVVS